MPTYDERLAEFKAKGLTDKQINIDYFGPHSLDAMELLMNRGDTLHAAYEAVKGLKSGQLNLMIECDLTKLDVKTLDDYQIKTMRQLIKSGSTSKDACSFVKGIEAHQIKAALEYGVPRNVVHKLSRGQVEAMEQGWSVGLVMALDGDWAKIAEETGALKQGNPDVELDIAQFNRMKCRIKAQEIIFSNTAVMDSVLDIDSITFLTDCAEILVSKGWEVAIPQLCDTIQAMPSKKLNKKAQEAILSQLSTMPPKILYREEGAGVEERGDPKEAGRIFGLTDEQMNVPHFGWHTIDHINGSASNTKFTEPVFDKRPQDIDQEEWERMRQDTRVKMLAAHQDEVFYNIRQIFRQVAGLNPVQLDLLGVGLPREKVLQLGDLNSRVPLLLENIKRNQPELPITPELCEELSGLTHAQQRLMTFYRLRFEQAKDKRVGDHTLDLMAIFCRLSDKFEALKKLDARGLNSMAYNKAIDVPPDKFEAAMVSMIIHFSLEPKTNLKLAQCRRRVEEAQCHVM